jgi:BMFP domain-containing protein YqiC
MREKIIDDLAGMMGGAAGLIADIRDQVRGDMRDRLKNVADKIDLITRDEFEALESRIAAIEALLTPPKQTSAKPKTKPSLKKKTTKK